MRKKKGARRPSEIAWIDAAAEAPRADLPTTKDQRKGAWQRSYVKGAAMLTPLLILALIFVVGVTLVGLGDEEEVDTATESAATTESRAVAISEVEHWLSGEPAPLPDGVLLGWNYSEPVRSLAIEDSDQLEPDMLSHNLSVASPAGMFSVRVVTTSSPQEGVQLVASPSLEPYVPGDVNYGGPSWPGAESITAPEAVQDAVDSWARALTSGQPSSLRLAVGDPEAGRSYMPLMGVEYADVRIEDVTAPPSQFDSDGRLIDDPAELIVRVDVSFEWLSQGELADHETRPSVTYDALVLRADTAAPQVVSWGGPGSGPDLEPYSNAIVGRDLVVVDPDTGEDVELDEEGLDEDADEDADEEEADGEGDGDDADKDDEPQEEEDED